VLQAAASVGDSAAPSADDDVDLHFVAFVCKDGEPCPGTERAASR
jgi:hypothetical protein